MPRSRTFIPPLSFDVLTPLYDPLVRLTMPEHRFRSALVRQARIAPKMRVLDLGCGTGSLAFAVKREQATAEVIGIDPDRRALEIARDKARGARSDVTFQRGSADGLPYADASFDRVLSSLALHHMSQQTKRAALRECARVLGVGGELHVADWGPPQDALMRIMSWPFRIFDGLEFTADNYQGLLPQFFRDAGFRNVVETQRLRTIFGTLTLYRAEKTATAVEQDFTPGQRDTVASGSERPE